MTFHTPVLHVHAAHSITWMQLQERNVPRGRCS